MTIAELLTQKIQSLPPAMQDEIWQFTEQLIQKWQQPVMDDSLTLTKPKPKNILEKHLSVADVAGSLKDKTTVKATIEDMNDSIFHG